MLLELTLVSLLVCLFGGILLLNVMQLPGRRWGWVVGGFWVVLGLIPVVSGWLYSVQLRSTLVLVGGDLWGFGVPVVSLWQGGTLLAGVVPVATFMLLTLVRPTARTTSALCGLAVLAVSGLLFTLTTSVVLMFVAFELLLLVSLYLLRLTAKSDRVVEAVAEMFFWTLTGSVGLFLGLTLALVGGVTTVGGGVTGGQLPVLAVALLCLGFGVKLPIWPCFSWLLKAHVEASVEFSILLSGVVVKFGALGLQRVLSWQEGGMAGFILAGCCTIAILEASVRLLAQRDLKRVVALTTVIEVNWVGVCLGLGGAVFERVGVLVLVAHSLTTTAEFFIVECLYRRYHTRDVYGLTGVATQMPVLFGLIFLNILTTIGFPGTSLFAAKLLFLAALAQYSGLLFVLLLVVLVLWLPLVFIRLWVPIWYGQSPRTAVVVDAMGREAALLGLCVLGSLWLGLFPVAVLTFGI